MLDLPGWSPLARAICFHQFLKNGAVTQLKVDPMLLLRMINGREAPTKAVIAGSD
jgi:uncharacterized membrane protein YwzB